MDSQKMINIAVVGLGRMGKRHVHTLLYRVPRARVVAVCSIMPHEIEWAQKNEEYQDFGIRVYDDYDKMLQHEGLQAVWVSTSTDVHAIQTIKAVEKDLHVLCEKPLSTDLALSQKVVDMARAKPNLKVMAAFSRRFDASYRDAAKKVLLDRAIGKPYMIRSQTCDLLDHTGFFVRYAARNGGIFVDCAIHDIDLTLWFLDNPIPKACWATGTLQHHPELAEADDVDNAVGVVEFWGGKIAYYHFSRTQAHGHDVSTEVSGTEGRISVNLVPRANNVLIADKSGMRHEVQEEYWQRFEMAFTTEAQEFVNSILKDAPVPLPLQAGHKVMQIARALQSALWSGEVSKWNEKGELITEDLKAARKGQLNGYLNGHTH